MPLLRLTPHIIGEHRYNVEIHFESEGNVPQKAFSEFILSPDAQQQENFRWYLEDFPDYPTAPSPAIAEKIESELRQTGNTLFRNIFHASDTAREIWHHLLPVLPQTSIEIVLKTGDMSRIPWELMQDPETENWLALEAGAFVRTAGAPSSASPFHGKPLEPLRVLLVVSRAGEAAEAPFRSPAIRLFRGWSPQERETIHFRVLRPATFENLTEELRQAREADAAYHVVQFDGPFAYGELDHLVEEAASSRAPASASQRRALAAAHARMHASRPKSGPCAFLLLDNPYHPANRRFVDGAELGHLLKENRTHYLLLHHCRSVRLETLSEPETMSSQSQSDALQTISAVDLFARDVVSNGTSSVASIGYQLNETAVANFAAHLYAALNAGASFGQAATELRPALQPTSTPESSGHAGAIQRWFAPTIYTPHCPPIGTLAHRKPSPEIHWSGPQDPFPHRGIMDEELPPPPATGFFGRDEVLLELDNALETHGVVLLHGPPGIGKTAAAAEFLRWHSLTSELEGPMLFTTFDIFQPLAEVLEKFGQMFGPLISQQTGIDWGRESEAGRRDLALQVMERVPMVWVWDNVDTLSEGTSEERVSPHWIEQNELADFLRAARTTQAKFLLTSRRDEITWIGGLAARRRLSPLPLREMGQIAVALANQWGRNAPDWAAWRPLLRFAGGNPLILSILCGQALRDNIATAEDVAVFLAQLSRTEPPRNGEADRGNGFDVPLSLHFCVERSFSLEERRSLSLLSLFTGFVDVDALEWMGKSEVGAQISDLRKKNRDTLLEMLERAAGIGILNPEGGGYFGIHPAVSDYFKALFSQFFGPDTAPHRAFAGAMKELGNFYHDQYVEGNRDVIVPLVREAPNLLSALRMAQENDWNELVIGIMQGLRVRYQHHRRRFEWKRLVENIAADFTAVSEDSPAPGREDQWSLLTQYRVHLAMEEEQLTEAMRLQTLCVEWDRKQAAPYLNTDSEKMDFPARNAMRNLAVSIAQMGQIQCRLGAPQCIQPLEEAYQLSMKIADSAEAAVCAFHLGGAFFEIPALQDLETAIGWYSKSLELTGEKNPEGRANCLRQLGLITFEQFQQEKSDPEKASVDLLQTALHYYKEALELTPAQAIEDRAIVHNQIGIIFTMAGDLESALPHWHESVRLNEARGDFFSAGESRRNIAVGLAQFGRISESLDHARAALENFQKFGDRAAVDVEETGKLIDYLSQKEP